MPKQNTPKYMALIVKVENFYALNAWMTVQIEPMWEKEHRLIRGGELIETFPCSERGKKCKMPPE